MTKWTLSKSTTHQNRFLIVGDSKIISKPENQKKIRNYPKDISAIKDIDNTKLTAIYSTSGIEFGGDKCDIYINSNEKKKPTRFYYITDNSLHHTKVFLLFPTNVNYQHYTFYKLNYIYYQL